MYDPEFSSLGLAPGTVRGARSFGVDDTGRLTGVVFREAIWYPGTNTAECLKGTTFDPYTSFRSTYWQNSNGRSFWGYSALAAAMQGEGLVDGPHEFESCKCGFYGYYDGSNDYAPRVHALVSGVIEGWGETLIGSRGFRCSKARIIALTIHEKASPHVTAQIRDHYWDTPLFPSFEAMVAEFPPDKGDQ